MLRSISTCDFSESENILGGIKKDLKLRQVFKVFVELLYLLCCSQDFRYDCRNGLKKHSTKLEDFLIFAGSSYLLGEGGETNLPGNLV